MRKRNKAKSARQSCRAANARKFKGRVEHQESYRSWLDKPRTDTPKPFPRMMRPQMMMDVAAVMALIATPDELARIEELKERRADASAEIKQIYERCRKRMARENAK